MTNNFDIISYYLACRGIPLKAEEMGDLFFNVMLVRRGKDHPNLPAANYTFKSYYIDSIEKLNKYKDEMIKCCDMFGLRAYVSINVKSKEKFTKTLNHEYSRDIMTNEFTKPWRRVNHTFGKIEGVNKVWIVDVDEEHLALDANMLVYVQNMIKKSKCEYDHPVIEVIPTKTGHHIITHPFDISDFERYYKASYENSEMPDIKRNHITLLYENLNEYKRNQTA